MDPERLQALHALAPLPGAPSPLGTPNANGTGAAAGAGSLLGFLKSRVNAAVASGAVVVANGAAAAAGGPEEAGKENGDMRLAVRSTVGVTQHAVSW